MEEKGERVSKCCGAQLIQHKATVWSHVTSRGLGGMDIPLRLHAVLCVTCACCNRVEKGTRGWVELA